MRRNLVDEALADQLVTPDYAGGCLAHLLTSVAAELGLSECENLLQVPSAKRYVVVLVDGLGWSLLQRAGGHARWFASQRQQLVPITVGTPSTTATSLTSLGTGLNPGRHGIVGYMFRPAMDAPVMNALTWHDDIDPLIFQPQATVFERLVAAGIGVSRVMPERHRGSGLTESGLRGGAFVGQAREQDLAARTDAVIAASCATEQSLVYVYDRSVDHTGHSLGVSSDEWLIALETVDGWLADLRRRLSDDTVLLVTGDHGMVDVPLDHRLVVESEPELVRDLDDLAGEGRFRQLYTRAGDDVARRWQNLLGERAWVRTREQAVAEGWFGEVSEVVHDRIGDVVVAARDQWAVMSTTLPGEFTLVGMHGSLTPAEMMVPLVMSGGVPCTSPS